MAKKIAINGFGRIGRAFFRLAWDREEFDIVAINDLGDHENLAYLLKYDSVYGDAPFEVDTKNGNLIVDGKEVTFLNEKDPSKLPWKDMDIDVVVEATGVFASYEKAKVHLEAGSKRIVITAPVKDDPEKAGVKGATVLMGVNNNTLSNCQISSNGSCTTNAGSPVVTILDEELGIEKAILNTVHGYTASQSLVDGLNKKDFRKGRAAAENIIPTSTGAAIAVSKAVTSLKDKFDGVAMRVPVKAGSIADITFLSKRDTTVEEVNEILEKAEKEERWQGIFKTTREQLVSNDIIGTTHASIADLTFTRVVDGTLVKVLSWYDNEAGYTHSLIKHVIETAKYVN